MRKQKALQALILVFFVYESLLIFKKFFRGPVTPTLKELPLTNVATPQTPQPSVARLAKSLLTSSPSSKKDVETTHETTSVFPRTLIPFKLHQQGATGSSLSSSMPASFDRIQPDHRKIEHKKWIDGEILAFIGKYYPQYLSFYKDLPHPIYRADLARYMLVNTFGGLYSDAV